MFKSILNAISICLQGTPLQLRPKKGLVEKSGNNWVYSVEGHAENPPYVLVADEFKLKNDLISKLHCVDNRLQEERIAAKCGRAKWLPDSYEQNYKGPAPVGLNAQVEIYYKSLGLGLSREITQFGRTHQGQSGR